MTTEYKTVKVFLDEEGALVIDDEKGTTVRVSGDLTPATVKTAVDQFILMKIGSSPSMLMTAAAKLLKHG